MMGFERILVPTDFTALSAHAAAYARGLAETHGSEIHAVHVVVPPVAVDTVALAPGVEPLPSQPALDAMLAGARTGLANFVRDHFSGIRTKSDVLVGVAYSQICQSAQERAIDLIVIGSHARGVVHRIFMGSVSKAVLEHSPCPLLMVPLKAIEPQDPQPL